MTQTPHRASLHHRLLLVLLGALLASTATAQDEKLLAQSFQAARKVRAYERLQLLASLASAPDLAKGIQSGTKGASLLPAEDALTGASWVAVLNTAGERLSARGEAPADLGRRAAVQKALAAFLRDDLIASPNGPLFLAAAPIGAGGKVIGALVAAWPESYMLDDAAKSSCGCQAMLVTNGGVAAGEALPAEDAASLLTSFQASPSFDIQLSQTPAKKQMVAYVPLSGELSGAAYLLLFAERQAATTAATSAPNKDYVPQLLVLVSSLLLGAVLLLMLRASKKEKNFFDEAGLILQIPLLYQDFLDAKVRCGESIDAITQDRFSLKVRESCALFSKVYNHPRIKVAVAIKNSRAQLVATPIQ